MLFFALVLEKLKQHKLLIGLCLGTLAISFVVGSVGYQLGAVIIGLLIAVPLIYQSVIDTYFGLYFLTWYSYFLFYLARL